VIEEREDEPPEEELNRGVRNDRKIDQLNSDLRARIAVAEEASKKEMIRAQ
jgi:hypothetical protein